MKKIIFYLYEDYNEHYIETLNNLKYEVQKKCDDCCIKTHQLLFLTPQLAINYNFEIIIKENQLSEFFIKYNKETQKLECDRTNRQLTSESCLYKLLLSGEFNKIDEIKPNKLKTKSILIEQKCFDILKFSNEDYVLNIPESNYILLKHQLLNVIENILKANEIGEKRIYTAELEHYVIEILRKYGFKYECDGLWNEKCAEIRWL